MVDWQPRSPSRDWTVLRDRIAPAEAGEAREVRVGRVELGLMLDRQRGQVRVGGEIAGRAQRLEQAKEDLDVPIAGMHDARAGPREPRAHVGAGPGHGQWIFEHLSAGREADEPEE